MVKITTKAAVFFIQKYLYQAFFMQMEKIKSDMSKPKKKAKFSLSCSFNILLETKSAENK
ncbi:MAG: hypothetical protein SCARUB_01878 [Candidatus Scalindua rubra]|uniref:Uncharacterized protein n=1 Tax=Candidatus Scalindua rubra TaxID=1872076 RepID=A0A1E3XBI7_9BACT|nr:MAG: hypothetical protein SCARUB_01878 [Candidatus Scalindua rubra]